MISEVVVPVLDQTTTEVRLVEWLVAEGDTVASGDVICEIETDKASIEIEAGTKGVLRKILVEPGADIPPLTVVALIGDAHEPLPDIDPFYRAIDDRSEPNAPAPGTTPAQKVQRPTARGRAPASPRARRLAEEHDIDLSTVQGTGPNGRILEDDVKQALERGAVQTSISRVAQATARRVIQSWRNIPHFYTTMIVDLGHVVERKNELGTGVTYTDFFAAAIAQALQQHGGLNGYWGDNGPNLSQAVHLGLVVQTQRGLVIPTMRDLNDKTLIEIAKERTILVERAHAASLSADQMIGGTFTLSNLGKGNVDQFSAIINPPQLAILAVGSVKHRPIVVGPEISARPSAIFTLGVDHRAINGRLAAAFLEELKTNLEEKV